MTPHADLRDQVRAETARLVDRLTTLGPARLARAGPTGATPADRAHDLAQRLADLAAAATARTPRDVPRLGDHAAGDQVAVLAQDVLAEGDDTALAAALAGLTALRRSL